MGPLVCSFCQNIDDDSFEVIAAGDHVIVVADSHPINRGHMLVLPTRHAADFASMTQAEVIEMALVAQQVDRAIRSVFSSAIGGTNVLMSNGREADQGVPHAHLHVIPRQEGDGYEFREDFSRYPLRPLTVTERGALRTEIEACDPSPPRSN
ncbi:HIT family protein [Curtobacterium flaccumfaciens]|jgi:diadenosine tetraphosphate (Ap4A) HIT family hydrolase|uniref:HIT family protein n=1 Tax=Curtobacterium flaccumfaciens TaxID=2035 RepID=UPI001BDF2ECC|nr:HIT domain-containing protein [Curtobacterium flaccumfaciens]MBT1595929.1 HIT domain-containing protein [Curtobacterium flaccumfaciens pv. flaccumfaciens]